MRIPTKMNTKQTLVSYLAGVAISISAGNVEAEQIELQQLPAGVVEDAIAEVAKNDWKAHEKKAVLSIAAKDKRPTVRRSACQQLMQLRNQFEWNEVAPLLEQLAADKESLVRTEVGRALSYKLKDASYFDRFWIVSDWAHADSPWKRLAIAHALAQNVDSAGINDIATHLAADPNANVRLAAVNIAASRLHKDPTHHQNLLQLLSDDPNRRVRRTARRVLDVLNSL